MHHITRITVTIEATGPVAWPHFAGSTLRGAFGRALRRTACVTGQSTCQACPLRHSCAYGVVFDPAPPPQPLHPSFRNGLPLYALQAPALGASRLNKGSVQTFSVLLLPHTPTHLSLIEHILPVTVGKELIAPGLFKLLHTQVSQTPMPSQLPAPPAASTALDAHTSTNTGSVTLRWHTPLRLQHQGKPLFKADQLNATQLVLALLRRQMQWHQITQQTPDTDPHTQRQPLAAGEHCTLDTRHMQWHDLQRHSGTQNQKLPLGGLIGSATLHGPLAALAALQPLLQLGEQLHLGKETVMGLGRYQLSPLQAN